MMRKMLIAATMLMLCNVAWSAENYPNRPVRIVVGFGSGGPDASARILAQALSTQTGQQFVVDNRPGASGIIGADIVAKSVPDGYTLHVASATFALLPIIYKKLPFDVVRDFAPITQIDTSDGFVLVASPALPAANMKELLALARQPGQKVSYGSNGVGTMTHLVAASFSAAAKADMMHVPYKNAGATLTALMGGEVQIMFSTLPLAVPVIKSGKLRALAYDAPTRTPYLPDVPTLTEAGAPSSGIQPGGHYLFAPAKTPPEVLARLEADARKALTLPEVRERFEKISLTPIGNSSEQFRPFFANLVKRLTEVARSAGVEAAE